MAGSLWIVWTIMVGRLVPKIRSTAFAVCVGICGALLGGWVFILIGDSSAMQAVSLGAAAVMCAFFLWILYVVSPRRDDDDDDIE